MAETLPPAVLGTPIPADPKTPPADFRTPPPADLDLRLVRCFTVLAEHRHFGRAAAALHLTQPSLSRQLRRLERDVGARLLDRTPQGSRLTAAGEAFLPLATALLRTSARAVARTRAAARPDRVVVGYMSGAIVTGAVRELRRLHPDADVRTVHVHVTEAREALLDHRVDALVTRLPFATDGLRVTALYDEPRVVLVPLDHRLAARESVTIDDIADEPLPRLRGATPEWDAFWRLDPRPDGRRAPDGPYIERIEEKFELVASGQAVAVTAGTHGNVLRPDLAALPLTGVEPSHVVLATRADDPNPLVSAFRECATAHITSPRPGTA
ncbi:LysR family transcriptional regulator [Actinomadura logoneensis]|uniref:LysR family transcriptional regulator n=1 Tax=Actinomadura logoneensis TaxID=2293572 RepID=A0A372JDP5_9ACTN|nr:LysR family transcriptional regulator [Actinomadura logoneensis]RFU37518.1 LysR family transcriptional regulator [Actinomadura logoneensis]